MRTTLTLDDDLAMMLKQEADASGRPFRDVVKEALRRGLEPPLPREEFEIPRPVSMGPPLVDLTKAHALADALDDERRLGRSGSTG